ncbi:hypothetical protein [Devosia sp. UYZn731]|uniref:hypothetical protein n=1 Tax=Devosia sp. UYZn731 TaxID=3156345 RepID=UPI00339958B5
MNMQISGSLIVAIILIFSAAKITPTHASMDIPCSPISQTQADDILRREAGIENTTKQIYIAPDGYVMDASGMSDYCLYEQEDNSIMLNISGPKGNYYIISIARFDSGAEADLQYRSWLEYSRHFPSSHFFVGEKISVNITYVD